MITPQQLQEIKQRCEAATEGPWIIQGRRGGKETSIYYQPGPSQTPFHICGMTQLSRYQTRDRRYKNFKFISHARTDIPKLLAEIQRLQKLVDKADEIPRTSYPQSNCDISTIK